LIRVEAPGFQLRSVAVPEVGMQDFRWSVGPYTAVEAAVSLLIILFPAIALWLPGGLYRD
jgi:TRAP-type mannitol/chloroaromatic compound transport system permease large subunit